MSTRNMTTLEALALQESSTRPLVLSGARLLDAASGLDEKGDVLVQDKTIRSVGEKTEVADALRVDCSGLCLCPGLVDVRACLCEPGFEHNETIASGAYAAVAGGVSSVLCASNTQPVIDRVELVGFIQRRSREAAYAKIYPCASLTRQALGKDITDIGLLQEAGALAFGDSWRYVADARVMRQALAYARGFDALVMQHAQETSLSTEGVMNEGALATRLGLEGTPAVAESIALERDVRLLRDVGGRYHASHITTADSVAIIAEAKAQGLAITCDTSPPYFMLNDHAVGNYRTYARMDPPLRQEYDRLAIIEGLRSGVIDVIASDHCPYDRESKRLPFEQAAPGSVGLETLLSLALHLYHDGKMTLLQALSKVTDVPASLLGIDAGSLRVGGAADIVLFALDDSWRVDADKLVSRSSNTAFDGMMMQGRVKATFIDGRLVYRAKDSSKK